MSRYRLELPSLSFFSRSFTCPLWTLADFFFAIVFSRFRDYHRIQFRGTLFLSLGDSFCTFDVILGDIWGTKLGKNLQIGNTQIKNLQTTEQTLTLENKRFTAVCLQILYFSLQWVHFPTQNVAKMLWRTSSEVISVPVISPRWWRHWRRSSAIRSVGVWSAKACLARRRASRDWSSAL